VTGRPDWSFALVGATDTSYEGGVIWDPPAWNPPLTLGGNTYTITVWDNDDNADPTNDSDGLIWIRSEAIGPRNSRCTIETLVTATATNDPIHGYNAQEGGGSGKNFTSNDAVGINFGAPGFGNRNLHVGG